MFQLCVMHRQQQRGRGGLERFIHFHCNWLSLFSARFSAHWLKWSVFSTIFSRLVELVALKKERANSIVLYESLSSPPFPLLECCRCTKHNWRQNSLSPYSATQHQHLFSIFLSLSFTLLYWYCKNKNLSVCI